MQPEATPHAAWMDAFFASYYAHRPVNATFIGVHDFDDRLPDLSESGAGDALADARDLLRRSERAVPGAPPGGPTPGGPPAPGGPAGAAPGAPLGGPPPPGAAPLGPFEAIDRRLARGFLRIQEWELGCAHFHRGNPSLYTGEAVFAVIGLFLTDFAPLAERVDAATARMDQVAGFLARARENVRRAPAAWTERAIRECDGALALFTDGVAELVATHALHARALMAAAARAARAFADHRARLEAELARPSDAYACGAEPFEVMLRDAHFLAESAEEVVAHAEDALAEAAAQLARQASRFGASTPAEALAGLTELHPTAGGYYARHGEVWEDVRRIAERKALLTWPDFPIRYVPRPGWVRGAAPHLYFLFYRSPAAFGRPPVHDYLVAPLPDGDPTDFLRAHDDSVIKLNHVIHHGGLGHHVQNWHAFRSQSRVGRVAAVDCASRIALPCGGTMAEGWACYATDLAAEAGMLTPLERYAELQGRVRMAARAVIDVRLHHGALTLDEAAAYYQTRAGMSPAAARGEAVRNSMFPGAALMYLTGTDAIHRLRARMERREGSSFDLRRFHDTFLSYGSIPVSLIAEEMTRDAADDGRARDDGSAGDDAASGAGRAE